MGELGQQDINSQSLVKVFGCCLQVKKKKTEGNSSIIIELYPVCFKGMAGGTDLS